MGVANSMPPRHITTMVVPGAGRVDDFPDVPVSVEQLLAADMNERYPLRADDPFQIPYARDYPEWLALHNALNNRNALDTCDLILFRGRGMRARLVQFWTGGWFSHVGVVHRRYDSGGASMLFLLESVGQVDALECIYRGRGKRGVRVVSLQERLEAYLAESPDGWLDICIVKVLVPPCDPAVYSRIHMGQLLGQFEERLGAAGYSDSVPHLLGQSTPLISKLASDVRSLHDYTCSELVGAALIYAQVLNGDPGVLTVADVQSPASFINGRINARHWLNAYFSPVNQHVRLYNPSRLAALASGVGSGRPSGVGYGPLSSSSSSSSSSGIINA